MCCAHGSQKLVIGWKQCCRVVRKFDSGVHFKNLRSEVPQDLHCIRGVARLCDGGFEGTARKSACNPLRRVARIHSATNHDCTFNNQFCISGSFSNRRHISSAGWSTDPCHMRHFGTSPSASRPNVFCIRTCILTSRQHLNAPHAWAAPRLRRLVAERAWRPGSPPPAPPSSPLPPVPAALCC